MAKNQWKTGDVVRIKSGGPAMTVVEQDGQAVDCVWFRGASQQASEFMSGQFDADILEVSEPDARRWY